MTAVAAGDKAKKRGKSRRKPGADWLQSDRAAVRRQPVAKIQYMSDRARGNLPTTLHLVVPNLAGPAQLGERQPPDLPALGVLLGRADRFEGPAPPTLENLVFDLFSADYLPEEDLPVAAVTRVLDLGVIDKGWWLRADPVYLRTEGGRLVLLPGQALDIRLEEAQQMAGEIADAYAGQGWLIKAPRPDRWYLKPPRAPKITTTPLSMVAGHDIHPYLPRGRDGMAWHGILTEMQILLHTANANATRETRGVPPINSLWFWGGGRLPAIKPSSWAKLWSEEPVSLALARLSETPTAAIPPSFGDWHRTVAGGAHLVLLDQGRSAPPEDPAERWCEFIVQLEQFWIAPALDALRNDTLAQLELIIDTGQRFVLGAKQLRRWYMRRRRVRSLR